jgi:hypothetical protein
LELYLPDHFFMALIITERKRLEEIKETKQKLEEAKYELEVAQRQGNYETASRLRFSAIPELQSRLPKETGESGTGATSLIHDRVTSSDIARVVARATGIPVQSLLKGEKEKLIYVRSFRIKKIPKNEIEPSPLDGRCTPCACRRTGPCDSRSIRCRTHFTSWLAKSLSPGSFVLVPWSHRHWQNGNLQSSSQLLV